MQGHLLAVSISLASALLIQRVAFSAPAVTNIRQPATGQFFYKTDNAAVRVTNIYVHQGGGLLGVIVRLPDAFVGIDATANSVTLLENFPGGNETVGYDEFGRIQLVGNIPINYYDRNSGIGLEGKIRNIGNLPFFYYDAFALDVGGKIQRLGNISFSYYGNIYNLAGKIQRIGNVSFEYNNNGYISRRSGTQPQVAVAIISPQRWRSILGIPEPREEQ